MRVLFTPCAERHFLSALEHLRREKLSAARSFRDRTLKSLEPLQELPESGRHVPEFPDLPYREIIVAPYRFHYRVKDDIVWSVNVWHYAQNPVEPEE